jgi:hypothetical protein
MNNADRFDNLSIIEHHRLLVKRNIYRQTYE